MAVIEEAHAAFDHLLGARRLALRIHHITRQHARQPFIAAHHRQVGGKPVEQWGCMVRGQHHATGAHAIAHGQGSFGGARGAQSVKGAWEGASRKAQKA